MDIKIIPISPEYRANYDTIFQRQETQDTWERPNSGRSYVRKESEGKMVRVKDEGKIVMETTGGETASIIIKKTKENSMTSYMDLQEDKNEQN